MSIADKLTTVAENVPKVYEAGKKAEYDRFWDTYQQNGERTAYTYAFYGWYDDVYNPKYPLIGNVNGAFINAEITNTLVDIKIVYTKTTNTSAIFQNCRQLKTIPYIEFSKYANLNNANFTNCFELENITVGADHDNGIYINSDNLDLHWSEKLTKASITSIINALSTTSSGLSITLSKTAVNNAFGIDVDDPATWGEGTEYYNLRHSKDNWSIFYL